MSDKNLEELPSEVLDKISGYLSFGDLKSIQVMSKKLKEASEHAVGLEMLTKFDKKLDEAVSNYEKANERIASYAKRKFKIHGNPQQRKKQFSDWSAELENLRKMVTDAQDTFVYLRKRFEEHRKQLGSIVDKLERLQEIWSELDTNMTSWEKARGH